MYTHPHTETDISLFIYCKQFYLATWPLACQHWKGLHPTVCDEIWFAQFGPSAAYRHIVVGKILLKGKAMPASSLLKALQWLSITVRIKPKSSPQPREPFPARPCSFLTFPTLFYRSTHIVFLLFFKGAQHILTHSLSLDAPFAWNAFSLDLHITYSLT